MDLVTRRENDKFDRPSLEHSVESFITSINTDGDYYDFRVRLTNHGQKPVRNFRLIVELPLSYAAPNVGKVVFGKAFDARLIPGDVARYEGTQEDFPDFVLYTGGTSEVLVVRYQVRHTVTKCGIPVTARFTRVVFR